MRPCQGNVREGRGRSYSADQFGDPVPVPNRRPGTGPIIMIATFWIFGLAALRVLAAPPNEPNDPAAIAPPVNLHPGPEYADSERMFQGIPSLERSPSGRLWATWYGGGVTEDRYNYVMLVTSGDDGATWSPLHAVLDPDGDGPVRAYDPCPWLDPNGRLWLFWAQRAAGLPHLFAMTTDNPDDEHPTWSNPRRICSGVMMCKPTVERNGIWLLPTAIWFGEGSCRVVASSDQGASWSLIGTATVADPEQRNCDEPMIVQRQDGPLAMYVRTRYGIGQSVSEDGGRVWSEVQPSTIPHPAARFFVRRLSSGNLLLVKHGPMDQRTGRSHLTAFLSKDDGGSWQGGLLLDARNGVSYPDGFQGDDGRIYIIYDFDRRGAKEILLSVFTEQDVLTGEDVSNKVRLCVLINKATGQNPGLQANSPPPVPLDAHSDGADLLEGPAAVLETRGDADSVASLSNGSDLFTDRDYRAENLPKYLDGRQFIHASIDGVTVRVARGGVLFAITPLPNRNKDSVAEQLRQQGFQMAAVPEFRLFGTNANICTTFQKQAVAGEEITLGKWGVLMY